ncbi:hypothetical protein DIPPA_05939 [Diplonema papillatum]|nr:hypothetical protein DIPPA_05939 [Diplonema papillatum]
MTTLALFGMLALGSTPAATGDTGHALDTECKGDDIFIKGQYQKYCDVSLDTCREKCSALDQCAAAVYNYGEGEGANPQWTDRCCWLKSGCSERIDGAKGKLTLFFDSGAPEATSPAAQDTQCEGDDIFIKGQYQKYCDVSLDTCREKCSALDQCAAAVYNYGEGEGANPQWTDRCCWLKSGCSDRREAKGKLTVLMPAGGGQPPAEDAARIREHLRPARSREEYEWGPVQLAEVELRGAAPGGGPLAASFAAAPGGSSPAGEAAANVVDGDRATKWLDSTNAPLFVSFSPGVPLRLRTDPAESCDSTENDRKTDGSLPDSGNGTVRVLEYRFVTGNDRAERDPVSWTVSVGVSSECGQPAAGGVEGFAALRWVACGGAVVGEVPMQRGAETRWLAAEAARSALDAFSGADWCVRAVAFEAAKLRSEPGSIDPTAFTHSGTAVAWDVNCEGEDVYYGGAYQRGCNVPEALCQTVCSRLADCAGYTYHYEEGPRPVYHDGCCALKHACVDRRRRDGRKFVVVRHGLLERPAPAARATEAETMRGRIQAAGIESVDELLERLSAHYGEEATLKAARVWAEEAQSIEEEIEEVVVEEAPPAADATSLPFFAIPRKMAAKTYEAMERELDLPRQRN